ncbi:uncharacterized protein LOC130699570 [Daphnia carinata]|uniref:uncharacterized protein LOC130699570 n=1 Tax=Daphnia carinata TaxID=120202 RepID=UPI00257FD2B1|nr:uncharacterized protein LOC130699570 [Daphnia carinata]
MKFQIISVLIFLMAGAVKSSKRQKRFILLKRILQMNGGGDSSLFRDPAPSCPPIYIQQQSQTAATQTPYYTTTPTPYYTTTTTPYYTTMPTAYYTSPAYNPPPVYEYTTPTPPPAYNKPTYPPSKPRYEQLPTYLQMPPIYKPPTPSEQIYNQQQPPSSYQSPLLPHQMF